MPSQSLYQSNKLEEFTCSWNNHSLTSEKNRTPFQLLYDGSTQGENSSESEDDDENDCTVPPVGDQVDVSNVQFSACVSLETSISVVIGIGGQYSSDGYDIYRRAITLVGQH